MLRKLFKPNAAPSTPPPQQSVGALEVGKEHTFKDDKTGEFVYQRPTSEECRKAIAMETQKNAQLANQFIVMNRNRIALEDQIKAVVTSINASEKAIETVVQSERDKQKIDKRWGFNFAFGILERRDPPNG